MKLLILPLKTITALILAIVCLIFSILAIPLIFIRALFSRNIMEELNDWHEVFSYVFEWIWKCILN